MIVVTAVGTVVHPLLLLRLAALTIVGVDKDVCHATALLSRDRLIFVFRLRVLGDDVPSMKQAGYLAGY
jgi:hypothetical protein